RVLFRSLCAAALGAALACRVGLDVLEGASPAASLVYFLPRHATALALVVLAWRLIERREGGEDTIVGTPVDHGSPPLALSATLRSEERRQERLVRVGEIEIGRAHV